MPSKGRKNRFKIRCLECNPDVEIDFDHRNKHNSRFHNDLLKTRKHVRFEIVGAILRIRDAILLIRNDEIGLDGILKLAVEKCRSFGIDPLYEFSKNHRPRKVPKRIDENRDNFSALSFETRYVQEMFKVIDRLASDIKEIIAYLSKIVVPVTVLLPDKI